MRNYIFIIIIQLIAVPVFSQEEHTPINFIHIGIEQGLSQSTIFDITQDDRGNMWFATCDGLNKYDGYNFTIYRNDNTYSGSISGDIVHTLKIDSELRLWAGTENGLSLYASGRDHFINFYPIEGNETSVIDIEEINHKELLVSTEKGVFLFNTESYEFTTDKLPKGMSFLHSTCLKREGDNLYIGTSKDGVYIYSISGNTLNQLNIPQLKNVEILAILQQNSTCLWIATEGRGLFRINPQTLEFKVYSKTAKNQLSSDYIRALAVDAKKQLWVGTFTALNIYNEDKDIFITYDRNLQNQTSLSQTSVRSIYLDAQGGVWVGTYFGGVNYYHPLKSSFQTIRYTNGINSLNDNVITCIVEDKQKGLWIGTNSGGVNYYYRPTNTFTHYTQKEGLGSNDIKAIYVDERNDKVYIGMHAGGISVLQRKSGRIETYSSIKHAYSIVPTNDGKLWVSTLDSVVCFDPQKKSFAIANIEQNGKIIKAHRVTTIFRDNNQRLWFCGEKGINTYTETKEGLKHIQVLPLDNPINHKCINSIYESRNGIFWIGSRNGMYRFDEKKIEVKQYTTANGISNNIVHGVLEDSYGELWISTNRGLSRFQPQTEKFRNYIDDDGIRNNQFTSKSLCYSADGKMYFGGINGITTFNPELLADNPYTPSVVIKRLRLFNKEVLPGDDTKILNKNINSTQSITLNATQSMFSLEFVVSNYISGHRNTFAYMLKGYDKGWYYSNNSRIVSYSNLPQGTYQFLVKAANSDGIWNSTPTQLEIIVLPVWYKTWWGIVLFVTIACSVIIFIFYYFWMKKSMKAQIQMELADKAHQKKLNEMKLQFFINISHELRTPLTMILAPLQEVLDKVKDRWVQQQLEYVQTNTNRLLHLTNQLMDYRRAELGVFQLKVIRNNIYHIVKNNYLIYERLAQHKNIFYNFYSELEDKMILCDPNYIELIINNLISNAFKYTNEGQAISIYLREEKDKLILQVKDTGQGIPFDQQSKIFERFYKADNEHSGSGIGLALVQRLVELHHGEIKLESVEGIGSTFSIYLPTTENAYAVGEIYNELEQEKIPFYTPNSTNMLVMDFVEDKSDDTINIDKEVEVEKRENILIVEDNTEIRQYLSNELKQYYSVYEAWNGNIALQIIKEQDINLILTDVMMPIMDGLKLCKNIKQNLCTCHIPVIILSAKNDLNEQLEGLQMGADDYISKPFSIAIVTAKIKNIFRTRYRAIEYYSKSLEINPEKIALNSMDESLLKKAVEIMEKHISDAEFTTDEFAREMCMSRSNLHLKMKALTGGSTNEFIRKIRFNHACKLLKEGKYPITEISSMVGYAPSYFATSFKKYFGCHPSEYAKRNG